MNGEPFLMDLSIKHMLDSPISDFHFSCKFTSGRFFMVNKWDSDLQELPDQIEYFDSWFLSFSNSGLFFQPSPNRV